MARCIRCGAELPQKGECPACAGQAGPPPVPKARLLQKELDLDRRRAASREPPPAPGADAAAHPPLPKPPRMRMNTGDLPALPPPPPTGPMTPWPIAPSGPPPIPSVARAAPPAIAPLVPPRPKSVAAMPVAPPVRAKTPPPWMSAPAAAHKPVPGATLPPPKIPAVSSAPRPAAPAGELPPPVGSEIYQRVTRPDMDAVNAAAMSMLLPHVSETGDVEESTVSKPDAMAAAARSNAARGDKVTSPKAQVAAAAARDMTTAEDSPTVVGLPNPFLPGPFEADVQPTAEHRIDAAALQPPAEAAAPESNVPTGERPAGTPSEDDLATTTLPSTDIPADLLPLSQAPGPVAANAPPESATALAADEVPVRARPAEAWRRLASMAVDFAVGLVVFRLGCAILVAVGRVAAPGQSASALGGFDLLIQQLHDSAKLPVRVALLGFGLVFAYSAVFAVVMRGRTPGRALAGVRLVDLTGQAPRPLRALARGALAPVSFALLLGGFWMALFDRRGQTLHDRLAKTFVVRPI